MWIYVAFAVSTFLSVCGLLYTILHNRGNDFEALKKELRDGHGSLSMRVVTLETQIAVFWKGVTVDMGKFLHSPHPEHARMDYLLEKFEEETIELEEMKELVLRLKDRLRDPHSKTPDQLAAAWMLRGIQHREDSEIFAKALAEVGH